MLNIVGLGIYHAIDMETDGEGITDIRSALEKVGLSTEGLVVKENGQDANLEDAVRNNCVIQVYPEALEEKGGVSGHHDPDGLVLQAIGMGIKGSSVPVLIRSSCTIPHMQVLVERFISIYSSNSETRHDPAKAMAVLTRIAGEIDDTNIPTLVLAAPASIMLCWLELPGCTLSIEDVATGKTTDQAPIGTTDAPRQPVAATV